MSNRDNDDYGFKGLIIGLSIMMAAVIALAIYGSSQTMKQGDECRERGGVMISSGTCISKEYLK